MAYEPRVTLGRFQMERPRFETSQRDSLTWLAHAHTRSEATLRATRPLHAIPHDFDHPRFLERLRKVIERCACSPDEVARRGHELFDFTHTRWHEMEVYDITKSPHGKGTLARTQFYAERVAAYFERAYALEIEPPSDVIHVTCTGYISPSGAQTLVAKRHWGEDTRVTHAYHMGCYASLPAIRIGRGLLESARGSRRVDVVHTELCSLHLDPAQHTPEQLVVQSLFSDGFIRYALRDAAHDRTNEPGFRVLAVEEAILPDTASAMTWMTSEWGMQMTLARDVPERIVQGMDRLLRRLYARARLDFEAERRRSVYAIHPGGPRIIDRVRDALELPESSISLSREVLLAYGNMSSATLPHIWMRMLDSPLVPEGALVASLAFGPGLTVCGGLFKKQ